MNTMVSETRLIYGDCLDILPTLPEKSVEAIITDLPYGTTACSWDSAISFEPMWVQVERILKPRGVFVTTANQPFTSALIMSNLKWFRYTWVWIKNKGTDIANVNHKPLNAHEDICVFSKNGHLFNQQRRAGDPYTRKAGKKSQTHHIQPKDIVTVNLDGRAPLTWLEFPRCSGELHPTQKPIALYEYLIRTYTNEGDTVLDIAAGSGTTGVAAINTGRNCILIEKEAKYYEIMEQRVAQSRSQMVMVL